MCSSSCERCTPAKKPRRLRQKAREALIWGGSIAAVTLGFYIQENWDRLRASSIQWATVEQPTQSAAFDRGLADRRIWENWFNTLNEDAHNGAAFWAGERSKPHPGSCYDGEGQVAGEFRNGCLYAKQFLDPTDVMRRSEQLEQLLINPVSE
jgi:hypothetical protein